MTRNGCGLFVLGWLALAAPLWGANAFEPFEVGVRSSVVAGASPQGRNYILLSAQQIDSTYRLIKPVDEAALMARLVQVLGEHGFREASAERKPELLLTVQYGRGWLPNPFLQDNAVTTATNDAPVVGTGSIYLMPSREIRSDSHLMDKMTPGFEAKAQKAAYEKLFIHVVAWEYPTDGKAKARMIWQTTMVADDPDHRDLNLMAGKMLGVGAPYFGHGTKQPEVEVQTPDARAQVYVGAPEVVGSEVKPAAPVSAPTPEPPADVPTTSFNVPAGDALVSLQVFIQQSGERIIYPVEQVLHVRTRGVTGELTARAALDKMLEDSGLVADLDQKTGVFVIHRAR